MTTLHEHLARARARIKPLTKEQKSERGRANVQKRWDKYRAYWERDCDFHGGWDSEYCLTHKATADKRCRNPEHRSTSAPRITKNTEEAA